MDDQTSPDADLRLAYATGDTGLPPIRWRVTAADGTRAIVETRDAPPCESANGRPMQLQYRGAVATIVSAETRDGSPIPLESLAAREASSANAVEGLWTRERGHMPSVRWIAWGNGWRGAAIKREPAEVLVVA